MSASSSAGIPVSSSTPAPPKAHWELEVRSSTRRVSTVRTSGDRRCRASGASGSSISRGATSGRTANSRCSGGAKLMLDRVDRQVMEAATRAGSLAATVDLTGGDGGPRCARRSARDHLVGAGRLTSAPSPRRSPSSRSAPEVCPRARTASWWRRTAAASAWLNAEEAVDRLHGLAVRRPGQEGAEMACVGAPSTAVRSSRPSCPTTARTTSSPPSTSSPDGVSPGPSPARRQRLRGRSPAADRPLGDVDGRMTGQAGRGGLGEVPGAVPRGA